MITDTQTKLLYLADCLPGMHPKFWSQLAAVLDQCRIPYKLLPGTKDVWAMDYMPVQVHRNKFVQFRYYPDYITNYKLEHTLSDTDAICSALNIETVKSNLIVDGGNISKCESKVILCDKVFAENKSIPEKELIKQLQVLFETEKVYFVPWDLNDYTGHADGMVRFIDENTVLINDYSNEDVSFQRAFRMALHNAGLDWIELPYNPPEDPKLESAEGLYINFLQMKQAIIMPTFGHRFDDKAYRVLEEVFPKQTIATIDGKALAKHGGIVNCITWNILL